MTILFALRSNGSSLVAGAGARSVVKRIKIASLLSDQIILQAGTYNQDAGMERGGYYWDPNERPQHWQSTRSRHTPNKQARHLYNDSDIAQGWISWKVSFEPLREHLPPSLSWLNFETVNIDSRDESKATVLARGAIEKVYTSMRPSPDRTKASFIATQTYADLVLGSAMNATLDMDAVHHATLSMERDAGSAFRVAGEKALEFAIPDMGSLKWEEIDQLRHVRGWRELRKVWQEIDQVAHDTATSLEEVFHQIPREYARRLIEVAEEIKPTRAEKIVFPLLGVLAGAVIDLAAGGPPWLVLQR